MWSKLLAWDYSSSTEMILRYIDARILPGYAALEKGRICGYAFFVYEGSKGVIGDLFVEGDGGRYASPTEHPVETRLLTHVIETLQQSPGIHRIEAQLLVHPDGRGGAAVPGRRLPSPSALVHGAAVVAEREKRAGPAAFRSRGNRYPALERTGLPGGRGGDHRGLPRAHRFRDQRPVPHHRRVAALPEQHRALSRLRAVRRRLVLHCLSPPLADRGRIDPVLASEERRRPHHAGVRASRAPRARESARRCWRPTCRT